MLDKLEAFYGLEKLVILEQERTRAVSPRGLKSILALTNLKSRDWPEGFDMALETPTGKFATRFRDWYENWYDDLDTKTLAEVGRLAESHATPAERVYLDLTDKILDWQPGSFRENRSGGDLGTGTSISCFRQGHKYSIDHLRELGARTMRLFRPGGKPDGRNFYGKYNGAGRCFLIPYGGRIAVVNYYGMGGDGNKWGSLVAELLTRAGIEASHYLAGKTGGHGGEMAGIYINGSGLYIVDKPNKARLDISDVKFEPQVRYRVRNCDCCTRYYTKPRDSKLQERYCLDCGDQCNSCNNEKVYALLTWVHDDQVWLCESCAKRAKLNYHVCGLVTSHEPCSCKECVNDG